MPQPQTSPPDQPDPDSPDPGPADLPGWAPVPPPPPGPDNPDSPPDGEGPGSPANEDSGAAGGAGPSRTPGSTKLDKLAREGMGEAIGAVFAGVGAALNAATAEDPEDEIWLPTDDEIEGVSGPGARIIERRRPDLPGGQANDLADGISVMIPLAVYLVRNLAEWLPRVARARRGKVVAGQVVAPAPAHAGEAAQ